MVAVGKRRRKCIAPLLKYRNRHNTMSEEDTEVHISIYHCKLFLFRSFTLTERQSWTIIHRMIQCNISVESSGLPER